MNGLVGIKPTVGLDRAVRDHTDIGESGYAGADGEGRLPMPAALLTALAGVDPERSVYTGIGGESGEGLYEVPGSGMGAARCANRRGAEIFWI